MEIRKISIGTDYKSSAMHYIAGQSVLNNTHTIHLIKFDIDKESFKIYIEDEDSNVFLWKEFTSTVPVSVEYNINF